MSTQPAEPGAARADLHTHSTASDGSLTPADLVHQASRRGLSIIALTDHDTTSGLDEAISTGSRLGVRVVPGIELSTDVTDGEVHMLGYGIDPGNSTLQDTLAYYRESRVERAGRIIARLRDLGVHLPDGSVRASSGDASIGRPHIARAMIEAGYVSTVSEAFDRYLGNDKPAYIASERKPTPTEAIQLILAAGGLPVHAHPHTSGTFPESLPELIAAGLAGIEVYYAEYDQAQRENLAQIAARYGLLATGGSDYHGEQFKARRDLGSVELPAAVLQHFLQSIDGQPTRCR